MDIIDRVAQVKFDFEVSTELRPSYIYVGETEYSELLACVRKHGHRAVNIYTIEGLDIVEVKMQNHLRVS